MKHLRLTPPPRNAKEGFTRWDLLAVVFALAGLLALAVPVWSAAQSQNPMEVCRNNLRQIGQAFRGWAGDHGDQVPWRVPGDQGGTAGLPTAGNAWIQFVWLSNHLAAPSFLVCPADTRARVAQDWSHRPEGGFLHANYRVRSISYFVGLDVQASSPQAILAGDSNLQPSARAQTCDYAKVNNAASLEPGSNEVGWTATLHRDPSNILRYAGQVETLTSGQLRRALPKTGAVHEQNHILLPR